MMKFFRVQISKIKGYHYVRLPKIILDRMKLSDGNEIEISIREKSGDTQTTLWDRPSRQIRKIRFSVPADTMTINMYGRIYIPADYRFFFPPSQTDFMLETNVGNIQTHLTSEGSIIKGMRPWFLVNHPVEANDTFTFEKPDDRHARYRLVFEKGTA